MSSPNQVVVSQVNDVTTVEITTTGPQGATGATGATGPQGPAVSDGDKGDITVSNNGGTYTIDDDAVTYAKIQNVSATDRVLGRDSSGAGVVEEITPANLRTMINVEDGATGDQTDAEIKTAYENNSDTNAFTDAEKSKLAAIEASADVTDSTNVDAAGAVMNSDSTTASMSFVVDEDNMSSDSATKIPTQQSVKAYVDSEVAGVVDSAPSALNTLNELAAALGDDANFSTTVTNSIGTKLPLAGGTMTGNIVMSGSQTVDGRDVSADGTKLDGIESGATADQTNAEIRAAVEAASDSNVFTDADHTKLDGIEASADVTDATNVDAAGAVMNSDLDGKGELLVGDGSGDPTALAAGTNGYVLKANSSTATGLEWSAAGSGGEANQNAFSNIGVSGQDTVAADSATDTLNLAAGSNVTITTNASNDTVTIASTDTNTTYSVGDGGLTQNNFTDTLKTKLDGIEASATADQTDAEIKTAYENNSDTNVFTDAEKTKLSGIEASATADQTASEIRTLVESASDSNVFTDADHTKLNGIEASATADQTDAEIRAAVEAATDSNVFTDADHTKLNGIETSADVTDATNVAAAGAAMLTGAAFTGDISVTSTDTGSSASPEVELYRNSASPADADYLGQLKFTGESDDGSKEVYAKLTGKIDDASSGTEDGLIEFALRKAGSNNIGARLTSTDLKLINGTGLEVAGNISCDGTVDGVDIAALNTTVGNKLGNVVEDTTPQLGGNLDVQSSEITTTTTNGNIKLNPNGTGVVEVKGDGSSEDGAIQLNCSQNTHGVKIKSPAHSAGASYTLTLPTTDGNADQVLKTNGSGVLDWVDQSSGSSGVAATGGTFTGSVTFEDAINENVFAITDASSVALDPDNGMMQTWTLGANRTATDSLTAGQTMLLIVTASGSNYTVTWPTMTWVGGSAPTLGGATPTAIELFKVGSTLYGATVGNLG